MSRIHLIAIGGAIMHNLALALHEKGNIVSGSDDIIYDPSKSRLAKAGILPESLGWYPEKISSDIDFIILGMHAKADNPELLEAQKIDVKIYSFPEFIASIAKDKKRIVVAGSHGKTTTCSMIMHVLKACQLEFDYLVGAQLKGFNLMVKLSDAPIMVIEGDEYLSSTIDRRPKFLHYNPDLAIITGVSWDHINVFPTLDSYHKQFGEFMQTLHSTSRCYVDKTDAALIHLSEISDVKGEIIEYDAFEIEEDQISFENNKFEVSIFGAHNMKNLKAAYHVCSDLGIDKKVFFEKIKSFEGAAKRQQLLHEYENTLVYWDFAHAPSKVAATVQAFRQKFSFKKLHVILELHTYSSLNKSFLPMYRDSLEEVDSALVFFNPKNLEIKGMPALDDNFIKESFNFKELKLAKTPEDLKKYLEELIHNNDGVFLFMSSGQLGGLNIKEMFSN